MIPLRRVKIARRGLYIAVAAVIVILCVQLYQSMQEKPKLRIIFIPKIVDDTNEFWSSIIAGAEMAAREYDVDLTLMAPETETDFSGQIRLVDQAVEAKPDVLIISPSSYTKITQSIKKAAASKVKVVLVDSETDEQVYETLVATNNFEAGEKLGAYMRKSLPQNPQIGIIGHVEGSSTAIEREKGVRFGLGEAQKYIVDVRFCGSVYQVAYDITKELLEEYPGINVIAGLNEYSSLGAARAVKDLDLEDRILVYGIDNSQSQIQLLEEGVYQGIVVQNPYNMGYLGIEQAVKIASGQKPPSFLDSGSKLVTKEDLFTEENEKLLFPFYGKRATKKEDIKDR